MYHLKLTRALSYSGVVTASQKKPDVFVEDGTGSESGPEVGKEPEPVPGKALEEMTMTELETYAAYHNVSLKGIRSKAAAVAKIKETLEPEETENEADYGSPIMQELQEEM